MESNNIFYFDWLILSLNLYSFYLIGNKKILGFILGTIGSIFGILLFSIFIFNIAMIVMYLAFASLNIINYFKWRVLK